MNLIPLLSKIIGGSITGYVTNYLAIKMLFKKFGPFGGVIIKTKEEFIKKTSALVEREVINHKTLEDEMEREPFKEAFKEMIQDLISHHLQEQFGDSLWEDIEGWEESTEKLLHLLEKEGRPILHEAISSLLEVVQIDDLLQKEQVHSMMEKFLTLLLDLLREGSFIDDLIEDLYEEFKEYRLDSFIPEETLREIAKNLEESTNDLHHRIEEELGEELFTTFDRIYENLHMKEILKEIEESISQKTLLEILGQESAKNLSEELLHRFISSMKSPEGRIFLENILSILFDFLKELKRSPLQLLNKDLREGLECFLERELPSLIHTGLQWLHKNREDLEELIDETLEERLEAGTGLKNWIKKRIVSSFMSISKEYGIVNKILEGVENRVQPQALAQEMTQRILTILREKTIGEMVAYLEKTKILKREDLLTLCIEQLESISDRVEATLLYPFFQTRLGHLLSMNFVETYEKQIKEFLIEKGLKNLVYNKERVAQLQKRMMEKVMDTLEGELKHLIKREELHTYRVTVKEAIVSSLNREEEALGHYLKEEASSFLEGKDLFSTLKGGNWETIVDSIHTLILSHLSQTINGFKSRKMGDSLLELERREGSMDHITTLLLSLIENNMESLLSGKVQDLVAENLHSLTDEEIQSTVEDFLGTELKPITTLGAIMGSLAGLGLYSIQSPTLLATPLWSNYLLSSFIYGGVGYVTNRVAIQMVFRPYEKKEIFGKTIPFTPGLVAKNKPRFAHGMGRFIEETLLTADSIESIFKKKRDEISEFLLDRLCSNNDDDELIYNFLLQNQDFIVDYALDALLSYLSNHRERLSSHLTSKICSIHLHHLDLSPLEREVMTRGGGLFLAGQRRFSHSLYRSLTTDAPIREVLPPPLRHWIHQGLERDIGEEIHHLKDSLTDESRLLHLLENHGVFARFNEHKEKSLKDLLGTRRAYLEERLLHFLVTEDRSWLLEGRLFQYLERAFLKEIDKEKRIHSLFHGLFKDIFIENGDLLLHRLYSFSMKALRENREMIYNQVLDSIEENLSFLQRIGFHLLETEETVREVIDELLDSKIPLFFQGRRDQMKDILQKTLKDFGEKRVGDIGIRIDGDGIKGVILFLLDQEPVVSGFKTFFSKVLDLVTDIPLQSLLEVISFEDPHDIIHIFQSEVTSFCQNLHENIEKREEMIHRDLSTMMKKSFDRLLLSLPLNTITGSIREEDVESLLYTTIHTIYESDSFRKTLHVLVTELFSEIRLCTLGDFILEDILLEDIDKTMKVLLSSSKTSSILCTHLEGLSLLLTENTKTIIGPSTEEYVLQRVVESTLSSLEDHLVPLFHSFDLIHMTRREIEKMDPRQIEDLFYSFASDYLKKVIHFGWTGSGVGLLTEFFSRLFL